MSTSVLSLPSHMTGFLHELRPPASGVYTFVSYPSVIMTNRAKYRNEQYNSTSVSSSHSGPINLMSNPRVIRGNTYSSRWHVKSTEDAVIRQRQAERRGYVRRRILPNIGSLPKAEIGNNYGDTLQQDRILSSEAQVSAARARVKRRLAHFDRQSHNAGVAPVEGRKHLDIQTDKWLDEIKRDRFPDTDVAVQTDELSRPSSPKQAFAPPQPGVDKTTQILPDDPDLFIFDDEVGILLEALVSRTLEHSLLEVIEEEEQFETIDES